MVQLNEVFGIMQSVPKYTYVDRSNLDKKLEYYLATDRHVVIHGASKQGKTVLRRKVLDDDACVVVQCSLGNALESLYLEILRKTTEKIEESVSSSLAIAASAKAGASGSTSLPFVVSSEVSGETETGFERANETQYRVIGVTPENLAYVISEIKKHGKRLVIEDFHYLDETEKRRFAFDLKAMYEAGVFVIIVGVWAQQNLLSYYNGDLSGRVEEIDIEWRDDELSEVIRKGQVALNVTVSDTIIEQVVVDAKGNVGLLQQIMESICMEAGVFESSDQSNTINNVGWLTRSRARICSNKAQRYLSAISQISAGKQANTTWEMYKKATKVFVEATDDELIGGLHKRDIQSRIPVYQQKTNPQDPPQAGILTNMLNGLNSLQVERSISPPLFYYNETTREVRIVDREFLFYRKYGNPIWPWEEDD